MDKKGPFHGIKRATLCTHTLGECFEIMIEHVSRAEPDLMINMHDLCNGVIELVCSKPDRDGFISIKYHGLGNRVRKLLLEGLPYSLRNKETQYLLFVPLATGKQVGRVGGIISEAEIKDL